VADSKIIAPDRLASVVMGNGAMQDRFALWCQSVTDNANKDLVGTGSPEGVVDAVRFAIYIDDSANDVYLKTTQKGINTGWKLL
jgi:hypothetical protein